MKKYIIGLMAIGVISVGLLIYTITLGIAGKQDKKVFEKAQEIAVGLNNYISSNDTIPNDLSVLNIKDIPKEISYEKKSEEVYEFCATYKTASSGYYSLDPATQLLGAASSRLVLGGAFDQELTDSDYTASYLSIYSHKKGKDCQTIKPYLSSSNYYNFEDNSSSGLYDTFAGTQVKARDTERETDIKALHAQIEAYFAQNGRYPSLANINDANWRSVNMRGLDSEALNDPYGYGSLLMAQPSFYSYSYAVYAIDGVLPCDNVTTDCMSYLLTATLEGGGTYSKANLN